VENRQTDKHINATKNPNCCIIPDAKNELESRVAWKGLYSYISVTNMHNVYDQLPAMVQKHYTFERMFESRRRMNENKLGTIVKENFLI